jgi:hypothetical protein
MKFFLGIYFSLHKLVLVEEKVADMRRLIFYSISFHNIYHMDALVISIMYWHFAQIRFRNL